MAHADERATNKSDNDHAPGAQHEPATAPAPHHEHAAEPAVSATHDLADGPRPPADAWRCGRCTAIVFAPPQLPVGPCPFCAEPSLQRHEMQPLQPTHMLPVRVSQTQAVEQLRHWARARRFLPSSARRMARQGRLQLVMVPFWSFDTHVTSRWSAERGHAAPGSNAPLDLTTVGWEPASGARHDEVRAVLVPASRGLKARELEALHAAVSSQTPGSTLAANVPAFWEAPSIDAQSAAQHMEDRVARLQRAACERDVGGTTHRNLQITHSLKDTTHSLLMVPLWIGAYQHQGRPYRVVLHASRPELVAADEVRSWGRFVSVLVLAIAALVLLGMMVTRALRPSGTLPSDGKLDVPSAVAPAPSHQPPSPPYLHGGPSPLLGRPVPLGER